MTCLVINLRVNAKFKSWNEYILTQSLLSWLSFFYVQGLVKTSPSQNVPKSFFLSLLVSLKLEHYTRDCEFRNFDKIKNKTKKKKNNTKKDKNLWMNFCLNKECPKLLCGLGIGHRRRQTIPMRNSSGEKGILQGITVCLVSAVLSTM